MVSATREIKIGLFVFIAFILLAVVVFSISDFYTAQPHYALRVRFNFANGIQAGAPVRLAGVDVGEVRSVQVYRDVASQQTQAELDVRLSTQAQIEEDAVAYINTLGLIGEKYMEIIPGTAGARVLTSGEVMRGKDSIPSEQLMEAGFQMVKRMDQLITSVNAVVSDEALRGALRNLDQTLDHANAILAQIRQGQGTVGRLLLQDDLYQDLKALMGDIRAHPWKLLYRPKGEK
ncbi:MAG: MCE family protein [Candidatus Omnitrophica bacterium]|nr:MCE family protein [Candidatus Omnitrophota bacterium]